MQAVKSKLNTLHAKHQEALLAAEQAEAELAEIIQKAEELEALVEGKTDELNGIEEELDAAESKLQELVESATGAEKSAEENLQAKKQLENRNINDAKLAQDLEAELETLNAQNEELDVQINEVSAKLMEAEEKLDNEDERKENADERVKQLEADVIIVGNSLRSMEINEKDGVERVSVGDVKLTEMDTKHKTTEEVAVVEEAKAEELEQQSDAKDEELIQARGSYDAVKEEMESLIHEINEI